MKVVGLQGSLGLELVTKKTEFLSGQEEVPSFLKWFSS